MTPYGIIYCITNTLTGKSYVGQTTLSLVDRWGLHKSAALGGHPGCLYFYNSIRKHGVQAFNLQVLDTASDLETLNQKEIHWICKLDTLVPKGYNLMLGGKGHGKHSPETIERMRLAHTGKKASEEARATMSAAQKGRVLSDSARANNRKAQLGKKLSEETKMKMSLAKKGIPLPPRTADHARKISDALKGKKASEETRAKQRASRLAYLERKRSVEEFRG